MALTISWSNPFGADCSSAHAVIDRFNMVKKVDDGSKSFPVVYSGKIYAEATSYGNDKHPIDGFNFSFELDISSGADQKGLLEQCYLHLKTQTGFTDGVDA